MIRRRDDVAALLRRRVLSGLRGGTLAHGDRLPSTRELSARLGVDPRVVLAAYRELAVEELVELRPRSGIYVAARAARADGAAAPAEGWLAEVLAEGIRRAVPATELAGWLRRAVETVRLRAAVVAPTADQGEAIAGELRSDFGLDAEPIDPARLDAVRLDGAPPDPPDASEGDQAPPALRRADLVVATGPVADAVRTVAERLGKPVVLAAARPDPRAGAWCGLEPAARILAPGTAREILSLMVHANLRAAARAEEGGA